MEYNKIGASRVAMIAELSLVINNIYQKPFFRTAFLLRMDSNKEVSFLF
jgi:hypothetical protein